MYHKTQPSESDYSLHILIILQKTPARLITLRESLCLSLCRDPHVLLDADAELDLDLIVMVDFNPLHQPGNDHVLCFRVGLIEGVRPRQQVGNLLGGSLRCVLFLFQSADPLAVSHSQAPVSFIATIMIVMITARPPIMYSSIFLVFLASSALSFRFCSAISAACSRL